MQLHMQVDGMNSKTVVVVLAIFLAINSLAYVSYFEHCQASVLPKFYVDDDYDSSTPGWQVDHFNNIQGAISASSAEDRIVVYAGTYNETFIIPHQLNLFGEDRDTTIIDGKNIGDVITINAQNVNISHFTIKKSATSASSSIIVVNSGNAIITDNKLTTGKQAITINNCDNNTIYDNIITSNTGDGIYLNHSDINDITYNTITSNSNGLFLYISSSNNIENNSAIKSNTLNGLFLNETSNSNNILNNNISSNSQNGVFLNDHCDQNTISNNAIYSNKDSGIRLENSSTNTMQSNTVNSNTNYGIMIVGSTNNVQQNIINSNKEHGMFLFADDNNIIYNNNIKSNTNDGIRLSNSTNDTIYTNEIASNSGYGTHVDYFSINNLIYNNYFHDNTNNAMDKSITRNQWNTTKTSGTNKVGGSYLCGNYWDDYDDTSEGATDSNGDGIADGNYTIYASNLDRGALLDVTPPTLGSPQVSPSTQAIGGNTYISITITDNIELKSVYLIVVNPNSQTSNFSIIGNETGNTYFCNKQFSPIGTFTFHVAAKDPRNWASSSTGSFVINEGTAPTITDNTPATGYPSKQFTFNATVTDDQDDPGQLTVKVAWSHGSSSGNYTMTHVYGNFFEIAIALENSTSSLAYSLYACDHWSNCRSGSQTTVSIVDNEPPEIVIDKHEYSSDGVTNTYTVGTTVTDNVEVDDVSIEYWNRENDHQTAIMDKKSTNYYEKEIHLDQGVEKVYCIVSATDLSGNENDTTKPFAKTSGPSSGVIGFDVIFDGSNSFDLNGEIYEYNWTFGDGITGTGSTITHSYSTNSNYTVTLTVTDDDGNTDIDTTYCSIVRSTRVESSSSTMQQIENDYNISLDDPFYAYDTDGDSIINKFVDPNNELTPVHSGNINISDNIVFLLSLDDDDTDVPEFIWNTTSDSVEPISHVTAETNEISYQSSNLIIVDVIINKTTDWIFLEIPKPSIDEDTGVIGSVVSVTRNDTELNSDRIIEGKDKIYILDDPNILYQITFSISSPSLSEVTFSPASGGIINEYNPMITITCNVPVRFVDAGFYEIDPVSTLPLSDGSYIDLLDKLKTSDNMVFSYTPDNDLPQSRYELSIVVKELNGDTDIESSANYDYYPYEVKETGVDLLIIILLVGGPIIAFVAIFLFIRYKNITLESFVYIKNKKIFPFFKPVVFGSLSLDINDEKISKAEVYVNGQLKDTLTEAPFIWRYDEPAFLKRTIETKVYDQEGKSTSSGEMTFLIFNPPRFSK